MEKVKGICEEAFDEVLDKMNRNYARFLEATHQPVHKLPWSRKVVDFMTLYEEARQPPAAKHLNANIDLSSKHSSKSLRTTK
ncbi:MAG: hypothetical protein ACLRSD_06520 [Oscillibacter sp.]